jgi:uncharacterized protein (DUF1330 family)
MSVYIIAQLKFTDKTRYRRYQHRFAEIFNQFRGQLLCAVESPSALEGEWDRDKIILMSFGNEKEARAFVNSPEYIKISKDREAGAETIAVLAQGLGTSVR